MINTKHKNEEKKFIKEQLKQDFDNDKKLPMHDANLEQMKEIHNVLKDQPEVLEKVLNKNLIP